MLGLFIDNVVDGNMEMTYRDYRSATYCQLPILHEHAELGLETSRTTRSDTNGRLAPLRLEVDRWVFEQDPGARRPPVDRRSFLARMIRLR